VSTDTTAALIPCQTLRPENIPAPLRAVDRWLVWRFVRQPNGDVTKPPFTLANLRWPCDAHDPRNWHRFTDAVAGAADPTNKLAGVGFVLRFDHGLTALDLDHAVTRETPSAPGRLADWAKAICTRFHTYTELSPSGHGLRCFLWGRLPSHGRRKKQIECYDDARYVTITGARLLDAPGTIEPRQDVLSAWHAEIFGPPRRTPLGSPQLVWTPDGTVVAPMTFGELCVLEQAQQARNGEHFTALWAGGGETDRSLGDWKLLHALIFWFKTRHPAHLDRLFRLSGRMRPKWDDRRGVHTYGHGTVLNVLQQHSQERPL